MKERLRASDYRFILICAALLAATTWFSVRNFYRAFPEASIDFKVSRDDARNIAGKFLSGQGYRLAGYRQAAQFTFDDQAKTFLERELGLERAKRRVRYRAVGDIAVPENNRFPAILAISRKSRAPRR